MLQVGTTLILILAANTSFTGFPFLASFAAEDSYLPRQLTKRGHRLVFSTGIIVLTVVSIILLWITNAKVDKLIPLYAIGVFTGFTMAGAGMAKYHSPTVRTTGAAGWPSTGRHQCSRSSSLIIIAVSKFTEGAWVILIILPLGVLACWPSTASTPARRSNSRWGRPRPPRPPCSTGIPSSSLSTASTWPRPAPSSTPAPSIPTSSGPSTSRWTAGCRPNSSRSGAGWG